VSGDSGGYLMSFKDPRGLDYPFMYPMMNAALNPKPAPYCGCGGSTTSQLTPGQAVGGSMAIFGAAGGLTGFGLGLAATGAEVGGAVGVVGTAAAFSTSAHLAVTGLAVGTGVGAVVGVAIAGAIYFWPDPPPPGTPSPYVYWVPCWP
jgi:hypothetical protein